MIHRLKHYHRNMGNRDTVINLIVVAYLAFIFLGRGVNLASLILGSAMLAGALLPGLFVSRLVRNPVRTTKVLRYASFAVIAVLICDLTGMWSPPTPVWLLLCPIVGVMLGANFWLFSDPRIVTGRGASYYTAYADVYDTPELDHTAPPPLAR